jgi:hypothetical protein
MRAQGTASSHPEAQGLKGLCGEMCAWECVREYLIAHSMDGPTRRRSMAVWLGEGFDLFVQLKMRRGWQHRGVCVGRDVMGSCTTEALALQIRLLDYSRVSLLFQTVFYFILFYKIYQYFLCLINLNSMKYILIV